MGKFTYVGVWSVYFALNVLVYLATGMLGLGPALLTSTMIVTPEALLGLVVLRLSRRIPWPGAPRFSFYAVHLVGAIVYGVLCAGAANLLFAFHRWLVQGVFRPAYFDAGIVAWQIFMAALLYTVLASVAYAVSLLNRLAEEEARAARATALQTQAELRALRAQVNPHFLFNTLHSVLGLIRKDPESAEEALEQFGDLMHYALRIEEVGCDEVSLESEWEFVRNYLALEKLRLGSRLRLDCRADEAALGCEVPAFTLQPLVENAIRHAIAPRAEGGTLTVRAEHRDNELYLSVADDGPGAFAVESAKGIGLRLVRDRLAAIHGDAATLRTESPSGGGFRVSIRMPARTLAPEGR